MKVGASISGAAHIGLVVFAVWGVDWFSSEEQEPLTIAEIELVDGTDFDAALSTAPVVQSEGPAELSAPNENKDLPSEVEQPEDSAQSAEAPVLSQADEPDVQPEKPEIAFPPPPTDIPTEAPQPSIAEIPSPDSLTRQASEPESPNATEPQRAVAAIQAPLPSQRPSRPPDPEPEPALSEPEPDRQTATLAPQRPIESEVQPETQVTDSQSPATDPLQPLASIGAPAPTSRPTRPPEPEAEPEPEPQVAAAKPEAQDEPEPKEDPSRPEQQETANPSPDAQPRPATEETETVEEDAPEGPAPQIAKLPVAKPADKAAAALAARKTEQSQRATQTAEAKPSQSTKPAKPSGSSAVRAPKLSRGERSALRVGIKKYYTYGGRRDPSLQVIIRVKLNKQGKIVGKPQLRSAKGADKGAQNALFQAGRRAIARAAAAGEFRRLPAAKFERWKVLNFRFSTDKIGVSS